MRISDWSSDVCSSDLVDLVQRGAAIHLRLARAEQVEVGTVQDQKLGHGKPGRNGRPVCAKRAMLSRSPKFRALARFKRVFEFGWPRRRGGSCRIGPWPRAVARRVEGQEQQLEIGRRSGRERGLSNSGS